MSSGPWRLEFAPGLDPLWILYRPLDSQKPWAQDLARVIKTRRALLAWLIEVGVDQLDAEILTQQAPF
jgi:hypothetical protein